MEQLRLPDVGTVRLTGPSPSVSADAEIARLRAAGYGWTDVARSLNARSIPTPSGRGRWWPDSARRHGSAAARAAWAGYIRRYRQRP